MSDYGVKILRFVLIMMSGGSMFPHSEDLSSEIRGY